MSSFFSSKIVQESMFELTKLQEKLFSKMFQVPFLDIEGRKEHLKTLREFLEKQKLLVFRISLSDDPEAVEMKEKIMESMKLFGFKSTDNINVFFDEMQKSIDKLEKTLDI